jgi:hypothetical protein
MMDIKKIIFLICIVASPLLGSSQSTDLQTDTVNAPVQDENVLQHTLSQKQEALKLFRLRIQYL